MSLFSCAFRDFSKKSFGECFSVNSGSLVCSDESSDCSISDGGGIVFQGCAFAGKKCSGVQCEVGKEPEVGLSIHVLEVSSSAGFIPTAQLLDLVLI